MCIRDRSIIGRIKKGKYTDSVDRLRDMYHRNLDTLFDIQKRQIPVFTIAGNFDEQMNLISYSGYLFFEIKYLRPDKMKDVRALLEKNPYIFALFKNTLGLGLCFIVRAEVLRAHHEKIFNKAHKYFEKSLGIDRIRKDLSLIHI